MSGGGQSLATGGKRILVTGGAGALGGQLVNRLVRLGHRVRLLDCNEPGVGVLPSTAIDFAQSDIRDAAAIDAAVAGQDVVFHVAALFRSDKHSDRAFFDVNVGGTQNVLEACRRHGVARVVYTSTAGVHGHIERPPADENHPLRTRDPYQQSKLEGERLACSFFARGLPGAAVRPTGIYGPGDTRLLKLFRAIARRRFAMLGRGKALYHLTYIDDVVDGMICAAEHPSAVGEVFLLAGPECVSVATFVESIALALDVPVPRLRLPLWPFRLAAPICQYVCRMIGVEPPLYPRRLEFFTDDRSFDAGKARRMLGWEPRIGVDEGVALTAAWYRERGWL